MNSPFKFLDSYTIDDREIFFGREKEIEDLSRRVFESKLLLVYGNSGTGKSSLIQCGLGGYLGNTDWLPLNIRRGTNIIQSLDDAIRKSAVTTIKFQNKTPENFVKSVHSLYLDHYRPVYFIFDQFEEMFIFGSADEKEEFIAIVKAFIQSDLQCRIIIILREEYLASATEFEREIPTFFSNRMRIERISRSGARLAIEGPCKVFGIHLEKDFSDNLLERLSPGGSEIELTYLQVLLDRVYRMSLNRNGTHDNADESIIFTNDLLDQIGNVGDLLRDFLDEQISQLDDPDSAISVLKSFVSLQGTRRQMAIEEIKVYTQLLGKTLDEEAIKKLVQTFIDLRFLTDKDSYNRYELRHDSLAGKIHEKITLIEKEILEIQGFLENAFKSYQHRGKLLSIDDLRYIAPYEERMYLKSPLREFLERSKRHIQRSKRRKIISATIAVFTVLILISILSVWVLSERNTSNKVAQISNSMELASISLLTLGKDPTLSYRLAEMSYNGYNGKFPQEALSLAYESATYFPFYNLLSGHEARVYSFDYTPMKSGRIVTASFDSTARIWDMEGRMLNILKGHNGEIYTADISPDGNYILTSSRDSTIRIWDFNGKEVSAIKDENEWNYIARFSPDSRHIVSGSMSGTATIWYYDQARLSIDKVSYLKGHDDRIVFIEISDDNKYIITTSADHTGRIWDFNGLCLAVLKGHEDIVRNASFSSDNQSIITSSDDATARTWDLKGNNMKLLRGHKSGVTRSMFSPDGKYIITVSDDGSLIIWNPDGSKEVTWISDIGNINRCDISPDSKRIAIAGSNGLAQILDNKGNLISELRRHNNVIWEIKFLGNENQIATAGEDGTVKIWNLIPKDVIIKNIQVNKLIHYNPSISENMALALSKNNNLATLDLDSNLINEIDYNPSGLNGVFSSDMKYILTWSDDNSVKIWTADGKEVRELKHQNEVTGAVFSPDNNNILTTYSNGVLCIWDLDGKILKEFQYDVESINYVSYSNAGKSIISCERNGNLLLWNSRGDLIKVVEKNRSELNVAKFSPDDNFIVSGSSDGIAKLWDKNGNVIDSLTGHRTAIADIGFSSDGQYFYTLSRNPDLIKIWDIQSRSLNIINLGESVGKEHYATFAEGSLLVLTSANNRLYIRNWPIHTEDILNRINHDSTLGIIRTLTDKEMIEYNIKF